MGYEIDELNIIKRYKTALKHSHYNSIDKLIIIPDYEFKNVMRSVHGVSPEGALEILKAIKEWKSDPVNTYSPDIMKRVRRASGFDEDDKSHDADIILMSKDDIIDRIMEYEKIDSWTMIKPVVEEVYQIKL